MVKIYSSGNYFYVVKDDILYEGLTSEVLVKRLTPTSTDFNFEKLNNWTGDSVFLADIQDEAGVAYTLESFVTFYENFNTGGGGGNTGSQFTEVSNLTTADYIYKSGMLGTAWQVNRYDRNNNMAQTTATQTNNTTITTLADAVAGILTLNYE